jgi:hypothetical protein
LFVVKDCQTQSAEICGFNLRKSAGKKETWGKGDLGEKVTWRKRDLEKKRLGDLEKRRLGERKTEVRSCL